MKFVNGAVIACALILASAGSASAACEDPVAVANARVAVEVECPCDGFPNHGQYVRCAKDVVKDLADANLLPKNCKGSVVRCAARSTCGKPDGFVTCCKTNKNGNTRCSTKSDAAQCKAPNGGSACVGIFSSCCDACTDSGCAGVSPTPTPGPTATPAPTATPTPAPTAEPTPTPYGAASMAFVDGVRGLLE